MPFVFYNDVEYATHTLALEIYSPNQNRLFYCCPKVDACHFFARKQQEPRVVNNGIVLFGNPPQYRYKIEETGETFNSTKTNAREALEERKFLKSLNALTTELDKTDIF